MHVNWKLICDLFIFVGAFHLFWAKIYGEGEFYFKVIFLWFCQKTFIWSFEMNIVQSHIKWENLPVPLKCRQEINAHIHNTYHWHISTTDLIFTESKEHTCKCKLIWVLSKFSDSYQQLLQCVCVCVCVYTYIYTHTHIYIYIYTQTYISCLL